MALLDGRRRLLTVGRDRLRQYRTRRPADALFPPGRHERAREVFERRLRTHPQLTDRESRLCELVEYYGFETAQKAPYCTPWLYWDDPRRARYVEESLGLDETTFGILHMYALFNRLDPARHDMYYVYDGLVAALARLGGPGAVAVLDFGCGLGQNGLGFAAAGYETVMTDVWTEYLDFVRFQAAVRDLHPVLVHAPDDTFFYDSAGDGRRYGLVIEWSTFEHIRNAIGALERILGGLVSGGCFVTTTFCRDWTADEIEHYKRDSAEAEIAEQYLSGEADAWLRERFDVHEPRNTIAKVLVKR